MLLFTLNSCETKLIDSYHIFKVSMKTNFNITESCGKIKFMLTWIRNKDPKYLFDELSNVRS